MTTRQKLGSKKSLISWASSSPASSLCCGVPQHVELRVELSPRLCSHILWDADRRSLCSQTDGTQETASIIERPIKNTHVQPPLSTLHWEQSAEKHMWQETKEIVTQGGEKNVWARQNIQAEEKQRGGLWKRKKNQRGIKSAFYLHRHLFSFCQIIFPMFTTCEHLFPEKDWANWGRGHSVSVTQESSRACRAAFCELLCHRQHADESLKRLRGLPGVDFPWMKVEKRGQTANGNPPLVNEVNLNSIDIAVGGSAGWVCPWGVLSLTLLLNSSLQTAFLSADGTLRRSFSCKLLWKAISLEVWESVSGSRLCFCPCLLAAWLVCQQGNINTTEHISLKLWWRMRLGPE